MVIKMLTKLGRRMEEHSENFNKEIEKIFLKNQSGASLVVQWLRVCLPMQGTQVQALVWEDPTCCRATRPVSHNY